MLTQMYDLDGNGVIDESELIEGLCEAGSEEGLDVARCCKMLQGALFLANKTCFVSIPGSTSRIGK